MVQAWQPEWKIELDLVFEMLQAAGADSLVYARSIRQSIEAEADISNAYDAITYSKGAAVLGMFESWMGRETFRKGVRTFLKRHSWGNARAADFLKAMDRASHDDFASSFRTFLDQPGLPIVTVDVRTASNAPPSLLLTQRRFLPVGTTGETNRTWRIPLRRRALGRGPASLPKVAAGFRATDGEPGGRESGRRARTRPGKVQTELPAFHRQKLLVAVDSATELAFAERAAFLDRECAGDPALRQRLEALLAAHEQSHGVLAAQLELVPSTVKLEPAAQTPDESVGQKIGRYKLLQRIGAGGCGAVYMAEQEEPVRRRVALKVIKLGMDTKSVIARFEAERQALALMDHPNIAKVLDAGATESGRPFFVMELVKGIKITDYCDRNKLSTRDRLDLFIQVCHAIQHAHQKGIIHRDIKPSNILVTLHDGVPVPKVIDFGIAKATEQRLTNKTLFTAFEQFIGTPAYTSPEQAEMSGLDIDTRSDIYALGVLLYELLTGTTPFDAKELMAAGLDEMRRTIREKEPVRPSPRLSTMLAGELTATAQHRQAEPLGNHRSRIVVSSYAGRLN